MPSEPTLALRGRGGGRGGTSPAPPSWAVRPPSLMLLARLTLRGSKGFVFSPRFAAYGVRWRLSRKVSLNFSLRGSTKSDAGRGLLAAAGVASSKAAVALVL